jgi:hypothetical protein
MKRIIATTLLGFAIGYSSLATSGTIQTIQSDYGCRQAGGIELDCPFSGGTWASAGISYVYFDFYAYSSSNVEVDLIRYSWTGTRTEQAGNRTFYAGNQDVGLATPNMATNPSPWDYYYLALYGAPNLFGGYIGQTYGVSAMSN